VRDAAFVFQVRWEREQASNTVTGSARSDVHGNHNDLDIIVTFQFLRLYKYTRLYIEPLQLQLVCVLRQLCVAYRHCRDNPIKARKPQMRQLSQARACYRVIFGIDQLSQASTLIFPLSRTSRDIQVVNLKSCRARSRYLALDCRLVTDQ
jgi:hypothetical protein